MSDSMWSALNDTYWPAMADDRQRAIAIANQELRQQQMDDANYFRDQDLQLKASNAAALKDRNDLDRQARAEALKERNQNLISKGRMEMFPKLAGMAKSPADLPGIIRAFDTLALGNPVDDEQAKMIYGGINGGGAPSGLPSSGLPQMNVNSTQPVASDNGGNLTLGMPNMHVGTGVPAQPLPAQAQGMPNPAMQGAQLGQMAAMNAMMGPQAAGMLQQSMQGMQQPQPTPGLPLGMQGFDGMQGFLPPDQLPETSVLSPTIGGKPIDSFMSRSEAADKGLVAGAKFEGGTLSPVPGDTTGKRLMLTGDAPPDWPGANSTDPKIRQQAASSWIAYKDKMNKQFAVIARDSSNAEIAHEKIKDAEQKERALEDYRSKRVELMTMLGKSKLDVDAATVSKLVSQAAKIKADAANSPQLAQARLNLLGIQADAAQLNMQIKADAAGDKSQINANKFLGATSSLQDRASKTISSLIRNMETQRTTVAGLDMQLAGMKKDDPAYANKLEFRNKIASDINDLDTQVKDAKASIASLKQATPPPVRTYVAPPSRTAPAQAAPAGQPAPQGKPTQGNNLPSAPPRDGYIFQNGPQGMGYYKIKKGTH